MSSKKLKTIPIIILTILYSITAFAIGSQSVTMNVGETKTLYLPYSVTSLNLKSCNFYACSPEYADIKYHSAYSVTVVAKKAFSSPVIIRCDYVYYVLRDGRYVYGGSGAYDFLITVNDILPTSISLPETETLQVGNSKKLTPIIVPSNSTSALSWKSTDPSTIYVDQTGRILAQKTGTSVITVTTANGLYDKCTVTAYRPETSVTSIKVSPATLLLDVGNESALSATISPSNATNKSVSWSSSNTGVVTVNSTGKVKAIKEGCATIYAKSNNGKKDSCVVTCKETIPTLTLTDKVDISSIPSEANIIYKRTFYTGWNSLCVPFAVKSSYIDGCKLAIVKEKEVRGANKYFSFKCVDEVSAGTPCLVWVDKDTVCDFQLSKQTLAQEPINDGIMKGTFSKITIGTGCYKLSEDGDSFSPTISEDAEVKAFRIYIKL